MEDINKLFISAGVGASSKIRKIKSEEEAEKRRVDKEANDQARRAEAVAQSVLDAKKKMAVMVDKLFAKPSRLSQFIDELASSNAIDLYSHFYDISPIRHIGKMPRRATTVRKAFGDIAGFGNNKVWIVPNFKVTYSLIDLATFTGSDGKEFILALAVARTTCLADKDFKINIRKYEVVCYRVVRWQGGSLHTEQVDFNQSVDGLKCALLSFAKDKKLFIETIMVRYQHLPTREIK